MTQLLTEKEFQDGVQIILNGGLVAFRTETVFGLGADATNDAAVRKLYIAKNRPMTKALSVQFASIKDLCAFFPMVDELTKAVFKKIKNGLTIVLPKEVLLSSSVPIAPSVLAGHDSIAVRIPNDKFSQKFLQACGRPLAVPSANTSAQTPPVTWNAVYDDLNKRIEAIFMSKPCKLGVESTIIKLTDGGIQILRRGAVSPEILAKKTGLATYE